MLYLLNFRRCAISNPGAPTTIPDWNTLYTTLKNDKATTPAGLSRQCLWLLQYGSAAAPISDNDRRLLPIPQSPFVTGGTYLRTNAKAYLSNQLERISELLQLIQISPLGHKIDNLIAIIPHSGINALSMIYADSLCVVKDTELGTRKHHIRAAAGENKVIWIQMTTPVRIAQIKFEAILRRLPKLSDGTPYKLLWSFSQLNDSSITENLPLSVICGKKIFLLDHPEFLSHSGYTPDKASIDMMIIKLESSLGSDIFLDSILSGAPSGDRRSVIQNTLPNVSQTPIDESPYQLLGTRWVARFESIRLRCRQDLTRNNDIKKLMGTLQTSLFIARRQLYSGRLEDQYSGIRTMADSMLVAETLCDTAFLAPEDLTGFFHHVPDVVTFTNYGMTPISGALLSYRKTFSSSTPRITSMAHTYFETSGIIATLNRIHPNFCIHQPGIKSIAAIPVHTDVLVMEPHPNDVTTKIPVTAPSLDELAARLRDITKGRTQPLLVVLDITIGIISDPKLNEFIVEVLPLIQENKLHVLMSQSLVKFGALGVDVASAGLMLLWSKSSRFNEESNLFLSDAMPPHHVQAFYKFLLTEGLPLASMYLETIRKNTQYLSDQIFSKLSEIQLGEREMRVMDIHPNLDRGTCYIGIDFDSFLLQFNDNTSLETISSLVCGTIQDIAKADGITLTGRSSFGFPFTNISACGTAIRVTVGIETEESLAQLADIITIVAIGLKWHTKDLSRKHLSADLTTGDLCRMLNTIKRIARDTRDGFSEHLLSIQEFCVGVYQTEDGDEPNFEWQETGVGSLSWRPGADHFEWEKDGHISPLETLEINNFVYVTPSIRTNRAILLLSIDDNPQLFDEYTLNATLPPGMDRFAYYAFGETEKIYDIWASDSPDVEPVVRSIKIDHGTLLNGRHYAPETVLIHHNGERWKQSELQGNALNDWVNTLASGCYICCIQENTGILQLRLAPRDVTESWGVGGKTLFLRISDDLPVQVGKRRYSFDKIRLFENGRLSSLNTYWQLKQTLDQAPSSDRHIGRLVGIKRKRPSEPWDDLLVLVPESQNALFAAWLEN